MSDIIKAIDDLPLWLKIVLALPGIDIVWVVYRIIKSASKQNVIGILIGVLLIVIWIPFLWLIDILCLAFIGKVFWID